MVLRVQQIVTGKDALEHGETFAVQTLIRGIQEILEAEYGYAKLITMWPDEVNGDHGYYTTVWERGGEREDQEKREST